VHTESLVKVVKAAGAAAAVACAGCGSGHAAAPAPSAAQAHAGVTSPAFAAGSTIPRAFTCDGADVSPPLRFTSVPAHAAALALIVLDPDARGGTFVHWVAFDIPARTRTVPQGSPPAGSRQGRNSFGATRYGGPCPPKGDRPHRYVFTLYALSRRVALPSGAAASQVEAAVARSAIARGQLVEHYGRSG
jgi:Raf kinase inhibitor-like YbhB/YbcL family protein